MLSVKQREIMLSRPQQVNDFISSMKPAAVCNKCIADGLGWPNKGAHPAQITGPLATTSDFEQTQSAECSICHETRKVIRRA